MADTDDTAQSPAAFSRSTGLPAAWGKATEVIKIRVPDIVKDDFVRAAHSLGMDESSFGRLLLLERLYGRDKVLSMHAAQLDAVAGFTADVGPERATR